MGLRGGLCFFCFLSFSTWIKGRFSLVGCIFSLLSCGVFDLLLFSLVGVGGRKDLVCESVMFWKMNESQKFISPFKNCGWEEHHMA